jgi:hypothetical protein
MAFVIEFQGNLFERPQTHEFVMLQLAQAFMCLFGFRLKAVRL